jgi:hypothetical protein
MYSSNFTKSKNFNPAIGRLKHLIATGFLVALSFTALAGIRPISGVFSGSQEVPAIATPATGTITGTYNDVTKRIFYTINFSGLLGTSTAGHFHGPAAVGVVAGVAIAYTGFPTGGSSGSYSNSHVLTATQEAQLLAGLWYGNIHSNLFPGGEIRAQIVVQPASNLIHTFADTYSGTQENPPNASPATGTIMGTYNPMSKQIFYQINFSGLLSNTIAAHFHAPAPPGANAGVAIAHTDFPTGVMSGSYANAHILTTEQESQLLAGLWYSNIHTTETPGGEIRAQINLLLAPTITCPSNITVNNDAGNCSALVSFSTTAAGIPAPAVECKIGSTVISSPHVFPVGTTTVNCTATNSTGNDNCSFTVTVIDVEAPQINNLSTNPASLWPVNHKMRDVAVSYTKTDNCPGAVNCVLTVTSNEVVNGNGDGNTSPDWMVVDANNVKLRAERAGNKSGRIYTITVTCTDAAGNTSSKHVSVTVPHNVSSDVNPQPGIMENERMQGLVLQVFPNPSTGYFNLLLQSSNNTDRIQVKIMDLTGRTVDMRNNLQANESVQMGGHLSPGIYFAEVSQGSEVRKVKLVRK